MRVEVQGLQSEIIMMSDEVADDVLAGQQGGWTPRYYLACKW